MIDVASILIIDNVYDVRLELLNLIRQQFPHAQVDVISNSDTNQFLRCHSDVRLILCDTAAADPRSAFSTFKSLQAKAPNMPILLHCGCNHSQFDLLACISAGARGVLSKAAPLSEYIVAISTVMEGRTYLGKDVKLEIIETLRMEMPELTTAGRPC